MRFTDLFIRRPILATVVNLFLLLGGWLAIKAMDADLWHPLTSVDVLA